MKGTLTVLFTVAFIAKAASDVAFDEANSSEEVEERSEIDVFFDELPAICNALEPTDTEETEDKSDEYFFGKIFKRMRDSLRKDGNSTDQGRGKGRERGRGKGRGSRTSDDEGEARNSTKGRGFLKKLFEKKKRAGNHSSDTDGASKKEAIVKKLLGKKMGSESGDASKGRDILKKLMEKNMGSGANSSSDASDFLKKYFEGKGALYAAEEEDTDGGDVHVEEICAILFQNDNE
ncbi:uncharacterized protein LOC119178290 isoform X2 [Rhipicephalus microplus]